MPTRVADFITTRVEPTFGAEYQWCERCTDVVHPGQLDQHLTEFHTTPIDVDALAAKWLRFNGQLTWSPEGWMHGFTQEYVEGIDDPEKFAIEIAAQLWTGFLPSYENRMVVAGDDEDIQWVAEMLNSIPRLIARVRELSATVAALRAA